MNRFLLLRPWHDREAERQEAEFVQVPGVVGSTPGARRLHQLLRAVHPACGRVQQLDEPETQYQW